MFRYAFRRRHWPFCLLLALGALAGVASWAYSPSLPPEMLTARYANDKSKFMDVAGARAHVRDQGDPDGIPAGANPWRGRLAACVGGLGARAGIEGAADLGRPAGPRPHRSMAARMNTRSKAYADFIEVLVDTLKLDCFVLAGHSLGGGVAWTFAATRPDRVSQIILIDAAGENREAPWPTRLARLPLVGDIGIYFKPEQWVRRKLTEAYADPAMVTDERVKRTAELQRFPGNREAALQRARTQAPLDPTPLRHLAVPTLILWGAQDRWVPLADAFRFQNDIAAAKLKVFEKLGHDPMEEDPVATAAAVAAFLKPIPIRLAPLPPLALPLEIGSRERAR